MHESMLLLEPEDGKGEGLTMDQINTAFKKYLLDISDCEGGDDDACAKVDNLAGRLGYDDDYAITAEELTADFDILKDMANADLLSDIFSQIYGQQGKYPKLIPNLADHIVCNYGIN